MDTLNASEAGKLLHLNVKQVQRLARSGSLPAARIGRKWLFERAQLEAMLRQSPAESGGRPLELSARNQLKGIVTEMRLDGVMAEIRVAIGDQELVSIITRGSAERMMLAVGAEVLAVIKSTEVMIGKC
ncbi:MAG: TOBE domain-containing protein [Gemmatimonadota bacterium]